MVSYKGLTKAQALCALYNNAKVQGMGIFQAIPGDMTIEEAESLVAKHKYFDYVHGRVIKVGFKENDEFDEFLYDRDNGKGSAQRAIDEFMKSLC